MTVSPFHTTDIIIDATGEPARSAEAAASMAAHPSNGPRAVLPPNPLNRESEAEIMRRKAWPEYY